MSAQDQLDAAYGLCRAFNSKDVDAVGSFLSDNSFSWQIAPAILGPDETRAHSKIEFLLLLSGAFDHVVGRVNMNLPPTEVVQGTDKVVLLIDDNGTKKSGEPYKMQYILFLSFAPGTDKLSSVVGFADSAFVQREFKGWYQTALQVDEGGLF